MVSSTGLLYICVQDTANVVQKNGVPKSEPEKAINFCHKDGRISGARYTRPILQSTLQLMGCKTHHAHKISLRVFEMLDEFVTIKLGGGHGRAEAPSEYVSSNYQGQSSTADSVAAMASVKASAAGDDDSGTAEHLLPFLSPDPLLEHGEVPGLQGSARSASWHEGAAAALPSRCKICGGVCLPDPKGTKCHREKNARRHRKRGPEVISVQRNMFLDAVCAALAEYRYVGPDQRSDLELACRIREKKASVTVLLCGTSGCGKSTLASLLASRLGITTVVSTDSVRHMMRSFVSAKECPLLYASTYHAGDHLDPEAIAAAKARKRPHAPGQANNNVKGKKEEVCEEEIAGVSVKARAVKGFKAQSEMVMDNLDRLISVWEARKESVIVEGVHLSLNFVMMLMKKHPTIIPFMVFIGNEAKHLERFAVRAKYMALDPARNKYVKYIRNIRTIQEYLVNAAEKHQVPKINNTNVDKSVAAIHATVFSCLRRRDIRGEPLYDSTSQTVWPIQDEYQAQHAINTLSSKGMFQLIQREGSSRSVIQHISTSGRITGTWSVPAADNLPIPNNRDGGVSHWWETESNQGGGGKATVTSGSNKGSSHGESPWASPNANSTLGSPVNLLFGSYGLSAWASNEARPDVAGTSYGSNITNDEDIPSTSYKTPNSFDGFAMHFANGKHAAGEGSTWREHGAVGAHGNGLESQHYKAEEVPHWEDTGAGLPDKQLNQAVSVSESDDEEEEDLMELGESDDGVGSHHQHLMEDEEVGSVDESEIFMQSEEDRLSSEEHDLEPDLFDDVEYTSEDLDTGAEHLAVNASALGNMVVLGNKHVVTTPKEECSSPRARHRATSDVRGHSHAGKIAPFYGSRRTGRSRMHAHRVQFENPASPSHVDRRAGLHMDPLKEGDDERDADADVDEVGGNSAVLKVIGPHKGNPSSGREDTGKLASVDESDSSASENFVKEKIVVMRGGKGEPLVDALPSTVCDKCFVGKGEEGGG